LQQSVLYDENGLKPSRLQYGDDVLFIKVVFDQEQVATMDSQPERRIDNTPSVDTATDVL
jgi:hypothetical protein